MSVGDLDGEQQEVFAVPADDVGVPFFRAPPGGDPVRQRLGASAGRCHSLGQLAAQAEQHPPMGRGFHAFGDDAAAKCARHGDHAFDDGKVFGSSSMSRTKTWSILRGVDG